MLNGNLYEFCVKIKDRNAEEFYQNGDTFIEGRKNSEYTLYFKNKTYKRVKVIFSVDGLSVVDGKTASAYSRGYLVNGYGEINVPGWTINQSKVAKFQFTPQHDKANTSYVELLTEEGFNVDPKNQGVIGCMVFEEKQHQAVYNVYNTFPYGYPYNGLVGGSISSPTYLMASSVAPARGVAGGWEAGEKMSMSVSSSTASASGGREEKTGGSFRGGPIGANMMQNSAQATSYASTPKFVEQGLGTKFGDDAGFETTSVAFERSELPSWVAVINYDTLRGLEKRGIYVKHYEAPQAFPGYNTGCYVPKNR